MRSVFICATAFVLCAPAFAGALDVSAPATTQAFAAAMPAAQKVYPPLPTLAMLPPAAGDDDELPAGKTSSKKDKGRKARRVADCKCNGPEPRLVVSDVSRTYLKDVEARLDAALAH
jgi:hypothetical protein